VDIVFSLGKIVDGVRLPAADIKDFSAVVTLPPEFRIFPGLGDIVDNQGNGGDTKKTADP